MYCKRRKRKPIRNLNRSFEPVRHTKWVSLNCMKDTVRHSTQWLHERPG